LQYYLNNIVPLFYRKYLKRFRAALLTIYWLALYTKSRLKPHNLLKVLNSLVIQALLVKRQTKVYVRLYAVRFELYSLLELP
jgi:hypothetical protein